MAMAARRAHHVLATVGVFAALVAARVAVELFPARQAAEAIASMVVVERPPSHGEAPAAPAESPTTVTAAASEPTLAAPIPRRAPSSRPRHEPSGPSVRLIRAPVIPS